MKLPEGTFLGITFIVYHGHPLEFNLGTDEEHMASIEECIEILREYEDKTAVHVSDITLLKNYKKEGVTDVVLIRAT